MSQVAPAKPDGGRHGVSNRQGLSVGFMAYGNDKASISQASAKGKVKWFNATKG